MTPADIDRVFGRGRLRMVTGSHVEVFREEAAPGERRRYTKCFLATEAGDFREWTEREWRILARLVGHGIKPVPEVVRFDRGSVDRPALVQTYDAGVTVDHWATLLPLQRDGVPYRNLFQDCAHWWALARHSLMALDAIHALDLIHLDLKADNVCIPIDRIDFDHRSGEPLAPRFDDLTLIDFAFSLVSGERLATALPIAQQTDYEYQSPRLLRALEAGRRGELGPTRGLDWRCDMFSLAAMLWRCLPELEEAPTGSWTPERHAEASAFVREVVQVHDAELPALRPHARLIALASTPLDRPELRQSLQRGWTLAVDEAWRPAAPSTPVTRIAPALVLAPAPAPVTPAREPLPIETAPPPPPLVEPAFFAQETVRIETSDIEDKALDAKRRQRAAERRRRLWWTAGVTAVAAASVPFLGQAWMALRDSGPDARVMVEAPSLPVPAARPLPAPPVEPGSAPSMAPSVPPPSIPSTPTPPVAAVEPDATPPRAQPPVARSTAPPAPRVASRVDQPPAAAKRSLPATRPPAVTARTVAPVKSASQTLADFQARTRARLQSRAQASAQTPLQPRSGDVPVAWAVQGKPPPRAAVAPNATPPSPSTAMSTTPAPAPAAAPAIAVPAPPSPASGIDRSSAGSEGPVDFAVRANDLMVHHVPRVAQRAERLVSRVLHTAGRSDNVVDDGELRSLAVAVGRAGGDIPGGMAVSAHDARQLGEAARSEFARRGGAAQALALQVRAFGANPTDAEAAGDLAFLLLRQRPAQPEAARRLALYALTLAPANDSRRLEDWATLTIASALTGRDRDARNALLVMLALAPNPDVLCKVGIDMVALYGESLRGPVETMLSVAQASGRARSASCNASPR